MTTNRSMPPGVIIPELPYDDVKEAAAWLCGVFGFNERLRIGDHRCQLTFGEASLVVIERTQPGISFMMMHVDDVDSFYERARQSGAQIIHEPTDYPFGERQCTVKDIGGHHWTVTQTIADVDPKEWGGELV